ncbi:beta-catenin-like protein 1, partial [Notechis scutatus]|uniref:Beta-catenin-like protein 1 n=1 Tax=Notechis scutatus TaxID=8663 RepID=A0A6J1W4G7_9SAUR
LSSGPSPEHVCSILASLLRNLRSQQRTRLLNKFTENDSEKVDRLMELYFKYLDAMQVADKKIEGEKHDMVRRGEIIDDDTEEEFYLRRLDAGLFVLQLMCYIMAEISNAGIPQVGPATPSSHPQGSALSFFFFLELIDRICLFVSRFYRFCQ